MKYINETTANLLHPHKYLRTVLHINDMDVNLKIERNTLKYILLNRSLTQKEWRRLGLEVKLPSRQRKTRMTSNKKNRDTPQRIVRRKYIYDLWVKPGIGKGNG